MKQDDAGVPDRLQPQLCTAAREAPEGEDWLHEPKHDGYRLLARKVGSEVSLFTRGGHDWTARLREIEEAVRASAFEDGWLDGELVVIRPEDGTSDFAALQRAVGASADRSRLYYFVWDAPYRAGLDVRREPLFERKSALEARLRDGGPARLRYTGHLVGRGRDVFEAAMRMGGMEGIVSKRSDSPYRPGRRDESWRKIKCWHTHVLPVRAVELGEDGRITALLVGHPGEGEGLHARVEFGLQALRGKTAALRRMWLPEEPGRARKGAGRRRAKEVRWLPEGAVTGVVRGIPGEGGRLRHAVLEALQLGF
jgi:bifunctional non-homologous end joining protein LigD